MLKPFESSFLYLYCPVFCFAFSVQAGVFYSSFTSDDLPKEISLKGVNFLCFLVCSSLTLVVKIVPNIADLNNPEVFT